jgi:phage baseplate assembly protein W
MAGEYINVKFPFTESKNGSFVELTKTNFDAIKSDLMLLLLTNKGERIYYPDYGTYLLKYIFEPNDNITFNLMKEDIQNTINKYIPNLKIKDIKVNIGEFDIYKANVKIEYVITDSVFEKTDFVEINL